MALRGNPVIGAKLVHHGTVTLHFHLFSNPLLVKDDLSSGALHVRIVVELHEGFELELLVESGVVSRPKLIRLGLVVGSRVDRVLQLLQTEIGVGFVESCRADVCYLTDAHNGHHDQGRHDGAGVQAQLLHVGTDLVPKLLATARTVLIRQ